MALNAKTVQGGGMTIEPVEPGTYPGRLVSVVDLGVQAQPPYKGQEKPPVQMIALTYELVDEFMKDEDGQDMPDKPRWITEIMPFHNLSSEKAKSTLRYKALDPDMDADGDFSRLLNTPVNVTIVHNPGKDGRVYQNVTALAPMRAKDAERCPELVNESFIFDLDAPDMEAYERLPKWIQDKLQTNLGFAGSALQEALGGGVPEKSDSSEDASGDEENPF